MTMDGATPVLLDLLETLALAVLLVFLVWLVLLVWTVMKARKRSLFLAQRDRKERLDKLERQVPPARPDPHSSSPPKTEKTDTLGLGPRDPRGPQERLEAEAED